MFFAKRKLKRIKKQLESEYEERLKAKDEENKRIVGDIQEKYDRKVQKLRENVKELSEQLEEATKKSQEDSILINQYRERLKEYEQPMDINPDNPDAVPPILQPNFQHLLPKIVAFLDPWSFVRFISCAKILYFMAQQGILRTNIQMSCTSFSFRHFFYESNRRMIPIFSWKGIPIGYQDFPQICKSPWLSIELMSLTVEYADLPSAELFESKLLELLATLGIKRIDKVTLIGSVPLRRLWQEIKVNHLAGNMILSLDFLQYCKPIKSVNMRIDVRRDDVETQNAIVKFIQSSTASNINFRPFGLPSSLINTLITEWMNGDRIIKEVFLTLEWRNISNVFRQVRGKIWKCDAELSYAPRNWCRNMMREKGVDIISGSNDVYIFRRWDGELLRAGIHHTNASLKKM